jgi:hypothetical protein
MFQAAARFDFEQYFVPAQLGQVQIEQDEIRQWRAGEPALAVQKVDGFLPVANDVQLIVRA